MDGLHIQKTDVLVRWSKLKEVSSTVTFIVLTKQPQKWEDFFSFCHLWGFEVYVFPSLEEFQNHNLKLSSSSVWLVTNEAEFAQQLTDNPHVLILPTSTISNFVRFLEEYSLELASPIEVKT